MSEERYQLELKVGHDTAGQWFVGLVVDGQRLVELLGPFESQEVAEDARTQRMTELEARAIELGEPITPIVVQ